MSTLAKMAIRELDRRVNDGFEVTLRWDPETDRVFVDVEDQRHGGSFEVEVDPGDALEAFYHPFAYAGHRYDTSALVIEPCPAGRKEMGGSNQAGRMPDRLDPGTLREEDRA